VPSLEAGHADYLEGVHEGSLGSVLLGNGQAPYARRAEAVGHRQHAGHRAHRAGQGELPEPVAVAGQIALVGG
jgi:hypothetical protein